MRHQLEHGLEVSEAQDELVRFNLRVKSLIGSFGDCCSHRQMVELNEEVRGHLEKMRRTLDVLRTLAGHQKDPDALKMLLTDVESHSNQVSSCQKAFREANLKCIARLDSAGRNELFLASEYRHTNDEEDAVRQSSKASEKLTAISRQLADTVERSSTTISTLAESSQTVAETKEELTGIGSIIGQSRRLITKYARREVTDKVLILFAVAFFFACVFYILRKRVLGPFDPLALVWSTTKTLVIALVQLIKTCQAYLVDYLL